MLVSGTTSLTLLQGFSEEGEGTWEILMTSFLKFLTRPYLPYLKETFFSRGRELSVEIEPTKNINPSYNENAVKKKETQFENVISLVERITTDLTLTY